MQPIFDDTWRHKALQGDEAAVQTLLANVLQPLYGFCLYRVGKNRHWCEEVVQETMLRALYDLPRYDPGAGPQQHLPLAYGPGAQRDSARAPAGEGVGVVAGA